MQPLTEEHTAPENDPLQQIAAHQHATILDEELQTLPNKYRDVLVMTYFAEQTSQQIAEQLDVSKGTVDGRIRQARNMLRVKLARRGVGVGVLVAAASLLKAETAAASPTLVNSTIELGTQTLSQSVPGTVDTSHIESLVRPEITSMIGTKSILSTLVGVLALAGVAGMSGGQEEDGRTATSGSVAVVDTRKASGSDREAGSLPTPGQPVAVALTKPVAQAAGPATQKPRSQSAPQITEFSAYPTDAPPTEKWLYETLEKPVSIMKHEAGTSLATILAELAEHYSDNPAGETMRIWPDRLALDEVQIDDIADVLLARDIDLSGISLRSALKLTLSSLEGLDEPLAVIVQDEVLMVTTQAEADAEENYFIRTYNVAALLNLEVGMAAEVDGPTSFGPGGGGMGAGGGGMGGGSGSWGTSVGVRSANLLNVVISMTQPPALWQETDGEGGTVALVGDKLVVRQNAEVHREIVRLLNLLLKNK